MTSIERPPTPEPQEKLPTEQAFLKLLDQILTVLTDTTSRHFINRETKQFLEVRKQTRRLTITHYSIIQMDAMDQKVVKKVQSAKLEIVFSRTDQSVASIRHSTYPQQTLGNQYQKIIAGKPTTENWNPKTNTPLPSDWVSQYYPVLQMVKNRLRIAAMTDL